VNTANIENKKLAYISRLPTTRYGCKHTYPDYESEGRRLESCRAFY
jgi:hypothetical protein